MHYTARSARSPRWNRVQLDGEHVWAEATRRGLDLKSLCQAADLSQPTILKLLAGRPVTVRTASKVVRALREVHVDDLAAFVAPESAA